MTTEKRIEYLTKKVEAIPGLNPEIKYRHRFEKNARYLGRGVYEWQGVQSRDTAVLFLKGVLCFENVEFKEDSED